VYASGRWTVDFDEDHTKYLQIGHNFALFKGWWSFTGYLNHALINEQQWEQKVTDAGLRKVLWTDGHCLESETVRVIDASPRPTAVDLANSSHKAFVALPAA
jgi:hypothetical protein